MSFVRSRLMLVGMVLAVPALQVGACAQKDRTYAGDQNGGEGNSPSEEGGSTNSGAGAPPDGGVGNGGAGGTLGDAGGGTLGDAGGGIITGGEAGSPPVDPSCVPTSEDEICSDGVDNDCDGRTDCLVLRSEFPSQNGAAAGADVRYSFGASHESATYQCRSAQGAVVTAATPWGDCAAVDGDDVSPIDAATSQDATKNGVWTTEVRLSFPDGTTSASYRRQVYIHNSMHGVTRCTLGVTDSQLFAAAQPQLQDAGAFDTTTARNPFVRLTFDPPVSSKFSVSAADGQVDIMSLRRRFTFSDDERYLLITRTYTSRQIGGMGCTAIEKRVHNRPGTWQFGNSSYQRCSALVLNKKGAGYCLSVSGSTIRPVEHIRGDFGVQVPAPTYSPAADNFAWRKLRAPRLPGLLVNFSPKCDQAGCGNATTLFLPDRALFPYWGG